MKQFVEQAFLHDSFYFDWEKISLIDNVEFAWQSFYDGFIQIVNKHAPCLRFRVKGRNNTWFTPHLSNLLHERNIAWAKARKSGTDWLLFRQLRNHCTFIRRAKSEFYLAATTENLNNPRKFWKAVKSLSPSEIHNGLLQCIMKDSVVVSDKSAMLECFNEYFIAFGSLF